jgi:hypothetical protein
MSNMERAATDDRDANHDAPTTMLQPRCSNHQAKHRMIEQDRADHHQAKHRLMSKMKRAANGDSDANDDAPTT